MKVFTRVVIDMNTLETLEEESFEYDGPVDLCKGGGGSSGAVDFPAHMKAAHADWLDNTGTDTIESSIVDMMNAALGNSPFASAAAYDPDTELTEMAGHVTSLSTLVGLLSSGTTLDTLIANVLDDDRLVSVSNNFDRDLSVQLDANVYPGFEAGMRDINSVMSSSFVIGKAIIEDGRLRESSKFLANLRYKAASDDALKVVAMKLQYQQSLAQIGIEANRIKIVAKAEEEMQNIKLDESDAKWDLEVFQYGNNVLASISGSSHFVPNKENNSTQSAIGGALSGAATGAMIGSAVPGIGTAMGAVVGGALGLAGGLA